MTTEIQLARKIEKALADDPRTNELGIQVQFSRGQVILQGEVASDERRRAVLDVVWEQAADADIDDRLFISGAVVNAPTTPEVIVLEDGSATGEGHPRP